jgi:hypothetical protein
MKKRKGKSFIVFVSRTRKRRKRLNEIDFYFYFFIIKTNQIWNKYSYVAPFDKMDAVDLL